MNRRVACWINIAATVLCPGLPTAPVVAQTTGGGVPPQRVGVMQRHGLAGVVKSIAAPQIVMEIPENVDVVVEIGSSTRVTDMGQIVTLSALHVGDAIFASGDLHEDTRTINAQTITLQPASAAQMLENLRANFGKTWTAGVITAVQGNSITLVRMDGQIQTVSVDQGTMYRLRDHEGSFDLIRSGERIRAQFRPGQSLATLVSIAGLERTN